MANLRGWCRATLASLLVAGTGLSPARGDDWPEWRGPRRDGVSLERDWLRGWAAGTDPKVAWRAAVGRGHSAVSISQGRAYTLGWNGRQDTLFCLDAQTGALHWRQSYDCAAIKQWPGPRATPAVHGGRVYTLSQQGLARCCDAQTGTLLWSRQLPRGYMPDEDYGFAWSGLIMEERLILSAGRHGLAIDTRDGSLAWGDDGQAGSCASPVPFPSGATGGVALIINNLRESVSLVGVEPRTGKPLWRSQEWPEKWGAACIDPVVVGNSLLLTTAEQHPQAARFTVEGDRVVQDWVNRGFACYTGSCVCVNGCVFGVTRDGILKCVDWRTGQTKWAQRGFDKHGALMAADGLLIVQASSGGDLVVARAVDAGYEELRRFAVFEQEPESFTTPVLANGRLYCRSYHGEVVCLTVTSTEKAFRLPAEGP